VKVLFLDDTVLSSASGGVTFRVGRPAKAGVVIPADKPWENMAVGESTVHTLQVSPTEIPFLFFI
jgi:hypothetical protein